MLSISDVTVTIAVLKPTPILGGFGKPLILGASVAGKDYKNYADIDAVKVDYAANTEEYKAAAALFAQKNPPAEIAIISRKTGASPVTLADLLPTLFLKDWHFLVTTTTTVEDLILIADAVEADKSRYFLFRTSSKADLATIKAKNYDRTAPMYHTTVTNYPDAAWVGAVGSLPVGSVDWKGWTLVGIAPLDIDATELNAIHALGANTYVTKAGTNVTSDGRSVSGEFIDFIHSQDYIVYSIQYAVQDLFNQAQAALSKIPYDNRGIAQIESAVRTVLQRAFLQGMIAANEDNVPLYNTTFPPRSQVDPAQVAARNYPDGQFDFVIAGSIQQAAIRGTIKFV
ncbi:DUF3383 family protein [Paenibacillus sp. FSL H8-0259]|uniref:DUF3383 family protein n=1 Tax=Paenibacillus sp. FSL H8-0259 TaxID=1920423 RepID=UPI00096FABD5|nr:DUF3383 family protein [Paenibacillus sp. FSL H8-0259]OMF28305.1 hypothetical protein BK132_14705 [Paenibacillus sp. FSL H8-0259]